MSQTNSLGLLRLGSHDEAKLTSRLLEHSLRGEDILRVEGGFEAAHGWGVGTLGAEDADPILDCGGRELDLREGIVGGADFEDRSRCGGQFGEGSLIRVRDDWLHRLLIKTGLDLQLIQVFQRILAQQREVHDT
jgi:hypothetical protein